MNFLEISQLIACRMSPHKTWMAKAAGGANHFKRGSQTELKIFCLTLLMHA
jgi:hypothetical protein